mgnify:CR=1 FL=1
MGANNSAESSILNVQNCDLEDECQDYQDNYIYKIDIRSLFGIKIHHHDELQDPDDKTSLDNICDILSNRKTDQYKNLKKWLIEIFHQNKHWSIYVLGESSYEALLYVYLYFSENILTHIISISWKKTKILNTTDDFVNYNMQNEYQLPSYEIYRVNGNLIDKNIESVLIYYNLLSLEHALGNILYESILLTVDNNLTDIKLVDTFNIMKYRVFNSYFNKYSSKYDISIYYHIN